MSDQSQKTEQPSQQRLRKARDEGRFPVSKEFTAAVQFASFAALLTGMTSIWWPAIQHCFRNMLQAGFHWNATPTGFLSLLKAQEVPFGIALLLAGVVMNSAMLMAQFAMTGFGLAASRIALDVTRLNPVNHIRELPRKNLTSLQEALVLLPVMLFISWAVIAANLNDFLRLPFLSLWGGVRLAGEAISQLLWKSAAVFLIWGSVDLFRQRRRYINDMKMTKQEVREEVKQNEGNPEIKMKIRRMRRELLRRRMMSEVPTATAVIMNPTHYAVALRYDMKAMGAPRVVAKGKNYLALRIKEKALQHQVPVIENPPLARALYKQVEVGQEIPAQLYRAVAEVLAYVFRILNGER